MTSEHDANDGSAALAQLLECTQPEDDNVHPIPEWACTAVPFKVAEVM